MPPDGVLFSVANYVPCMDCGDVYLNDDVLIAELTREVATAFADDRLPDSLCTRCGEPLSSGLPFLLCIPGPELTLFYAPSPGVAEPDLDLANWLLLTLRARRSDLPMKTSGELNVVGRSDLHVLAGGKEVPMATYSIPHELWDLPTPADLPAPGPHHLREAWDLLLDTQRRILNETVEQFGGDAASAARRDMIAGLAGRLTRSNIRGYRALLDPVLLTDARQANAQALRAAVSPDQRSSALTDRGALAMVEYERDGDAELVREASVAYREALECNPANMVAAGGLGMALRLLQTWNDDEALLEAAVDALRRAVVQSGTAGGDRAVRLNNLGSALSSRWETTHDRRDLAEAAAALAEAVAMTPSDSPDVAARLNNLGTVCIRTHKRDGGEAMLAAAIDHFEAGLGATTTTDPARPGRQANLAAALWQRDAPGDAARATNLSRAAATAHDDDPDRALLAASNWCRIAFKHEDWAEVTEAYGHALATSDLLLDRQVTGEARRQRLRTVQGLPDLAAFAWARLGDGLAAARCLDAGRARLLADALELVAASVDDVRSLAPALVERREAVIRDMARAERALEDDQADDVRRETLVGDARRLRAELADAMTEINAIAPARASSGHEAIARIAAQGPLVYVACTPAGTIASVVTAEPLAAELVWAPQLTSAHVGDLASGPLTEDVLGRALAMVGDGIVGRLAPVLHNQAGTVTLSLPAALARLPLAAAPFMVDGVVHRLVDDHVTALLPAATVVAPATRRPGLPRLGGVANPAREGLAPLTFAASELRAAAAGLAAADGDLLVGPDATIDHLLAVMGRCSHLHLACHGQFRPDDALESCLRLADGDLSLRTMQRVERLADLNLLVLSACESAQSDTDVLPDEMIGLPTAFLQLGARAVIGALWPVADLATHLLMARFYRHLVEDNLAVGQALRQAQNWLRGATVEDVVAALNSAASDDADGALLRAASRVVERKFGPGERPFAHESAWAGFVMLGHIQEADDGD